MSEWNGTDESFVTTPSSDSNTECFDHGDENSLYVTGTRFYGDKQYELSHTIVPFFLECSLELATLVLFTTAPGPRVDRSTAEWNRLSFYYGRRGHPWPPLGYKA